jgi:hypothetical protein
MPPILPETTGHIGHFCAWRPVGDKRQLYFRCHPAIHLDSLLDHFLAVRVLFLEFHGNRLVWKDTAKLLPSSAM